MQQLQQEQYHELLSDKKISKNIEIENLLKKRAVRSQSWIVAVQVLTKPYPCPWQCIFCPNEPWMPKSYISSEPGAMRALLNQFDPIKQVYNRLLSLTMTWHQTDKIEMIVLWWTHILLPRIPKSNFLYKKKLLQWLIDDYIEKNQKNIDMNEIFIMGSSAGWAMAWNLMVDSPDLYKKALITCAPKIPAKNEIKKLQDKPIWMVAAKKDPIVPFLSQKLARSKLKENTIVPEQCRLTIFPWNVYSPDWLHIAIPHLLAKVITTDFIPL